MGISIFLVQKRLDVSSKHTLYMIGVKIVTFITTLPNTRSSLGTSMTSVMNVINVGKQQACKHAS